MIKLPISYPIFISSLTLCTPIFFHAMRYSLYKIILSTRSVRKIVATIISERYSNKDTTDMCLRGIVGVAKG